MKTTRFQAAGFIHLGACLRPYTAAAVLRRSLIESQVLRRVNGDGGLQGLARGKARGGVAAAQVESTLVLESTPGFKRSL